MDFKLQKNVAHVLNYFFVSFFVDLHKLNFPLHNFIVFLAELFINILHTLFTSTFTGFETKSMYCFKKVSSIVKD